MDDSLGHSTSKPLRPSYVITEDRECGWGGAGIGNKRKIISISCGPGSSASLHLESFLQKKRPTRILEELPPDEVNIT